MGLKRNLPKSGSLPTLAVRCALLWLVASAAQTPRLHAQESAIQLDPQQTKIEFTLGDVIHTVHGTFKLKNGAIRFDPSSGKISGNIVVDATSGESGNGSRDAKMHREIIESAKFPDIVFTPTQIKWPIASQGPYRVEVSGQFRLHGADHAVTIPVDVQPEGQRWRMKAHLTIPYVEWGLKNPSNFILRVSDKVTIDIDAVGQSARIESSL